MYTFLSVQGNDDVYLCVNDGSRVTISPAYVSGRKHPELAKEVHSDYHQ